MLLGQISEIKTGLVLTRKKAKIKHEIKKVYNLITVKNVDDSGLFNNEFFDAFESNEILESIYFTQKDDILIRLSFPYTAVYINEEHKGLLVPSYFAIIKLKNDIFIPEYVAWYLNTEKVKKELLKSQTGTIIPSTNKNVLNDICIQQLSKKNQQDILNLRNLYIKEQNLIKELAKEKDAYYSAIIKKILHKN
ncbi:hypothetical protein SAMN05443428_10524 [Caloramator quimbayensis]|uniref:Type I restriction modification DNA specificity domain-containing protein n=1 Tax=Caloramator quimbayensis TaxID=1147123 RepID=A0A1T4X0K3_9CLOT|nr:restriction endonuclease [Caloramator quimbayensis]SKA83019.1 hypothetical protein SAMN05443428_10524 [Caloramator quimbayensis]